MTHATLQIIDPGTGNCVYLQRAHSGYPDGFGRLLKFIVNNELVCFSNYYIDVAHRLLRTPLLELSLSPYKYTPERDNAEYLYVLNPETRELKGYHMGKRIRMPKV